MVPIRQCYQEPLRKRRQASRSSPSSNLEQSNRQIGALALTGRDAHRLLQAEFQQSFAGDLDLLTLGEHLYARASRGPDACADGSAFAAAGKSADDCAKNRAAADFFSSVLAAALAL